MELGIPVLDALHLNWGFGLQRVVWRRSVYIYENII